MRQRQGIILARVIREEGLSVEMTFEYRPENGEGASCENIWENIPGKYSRKIMFKKKINYNPMNSNKHN